VSLGRVVSAVDDAVDVAVVTAESKGQICSRRSTNATGQQVAVAAEGLQN
jgi:hypothetical protein